MRGKKIKQQGRRAARAGCVIHLKLLKKLEITRKSLLILYHSELAWVEQSQAGINAHKFLKKLSHLPFGLGFTPLLVFHVRLNMIFGNT